MVKCEFNIDTPKENTNENSVKFFVLQNVYFVWSSLRFSAVIFLQSFAFYLLWILVHSCASNYYSELCAPKGITGILYSSLTISSPHCNGLRWLITKSAVSVDNMWTLIGTFFSVNVLSKINSSLSKTDCT